jgi:hypothetical protein
MKKNNLFNRHLNEIGENYFEHFLITFTTSLWVMWAGFILLCHSVLPFIFTVTTSRHVKKINHIMQKRVAILSERCNKKSAETKNP